MNKLKLFKPVMIDGIMVEEVAYDFDSITGRSIEEVCKEHAKTGSVILAQETDVLFHARIFANAADMAYEDMQRMHAKDFTKATTLVRDFFYMSLGESQAETSSGTSSQASQSSQMTQEENC